MIFNPRGKLEGLGRIILKYLFFLTFRQYWSILKGGWYELFPPTRTLL